MHNFKNKTKNNVLATATMLLSLATIIVVATAGPATIIRINNRSADAFVIPGLGGKTDSKAPVVVSGDNIYIAWWTNNTENGNEEVMFRASNDGGATFGDKINLSNSTDAESQNAEIVATGENNVFVSWWETNPETGSSESVLRASTDAGQTFGPMIMLGTNGTVTTTEEEGGGEAVEAVEEAVGGAQVAE